MIENNEYKIMEEVWKRQKDFNYLTLGNLESVETKQNYTKEMVLHLISETDEVLREINWKLHRKGNKEINRQNLKEEIVDVFKYWLTIAQIWDISPTEFYEEFNRKSSVVEQRFKQEKTLDLLFDKNIIGVDIDGVLADYPQCFVNYIQQKTGTDLSDFVLREYNIYEALGNIIPGGKAELKKLKHEFRMNGHEAGHGIELGVIPGSIDALKKLKDYGYTVVLLTARPYAEYTRLFADTIEWLKNKGFVYDALIWDENKEEKIIKDFPNMQYMIEDSSSNALKVASTGKKVFLLDKTYNQGIEHKNILRVKDWETIVKYLCGDKQ